MRKAEECLYVMSLAADDLPSMYEMLASCERIIQGKTQLALGLETLVSSATAADAASSGHHTQNKKRGGHVRSSSALFSQHHAVLRRGDSESLHTRVSSWPPQPNGGAQGVLMPRLPQPSDRTDAHVAQKSHAQQSLESNGDVKSITKHVDESIHRIRKLQEDLFASADNTSRLLSALEKSELQGAPTATNPQMQQRGVQERAERVRNTIARCKGVEEGSVLDWGLRASRDGDDEEGEGEARVCNGVPLVQMPRYALDSIMWPQHKKLADRHYALRSLLYRVHVWRNFVKRKQARLARDQDMDGFCRRSRLSLGLLQLRRHHHMRTHSRASKAKADQARPTLTLRRGLARAVNCHRERARWRMLVVWGDEACVRGLYETGLMAFLRLRARILERSLWVASAERHRQSYTIRCAVRRWRDRACLRCTRRSSYARGTSSLLMKYLRRLQWRVRGIAKCRAQGEAMAQWHGSRLCRSVVVKWKGVYVMERRRALGSVDAAETGRRQWLMATGLQALRLRSEGERANYWLAAAADTLRARIYLKRFRLRVAEVTEERDFQHVQAQVGKIFHAYWKQLMAWCTWRAEIVRFSYDRLMYTSAETCYESALQRKRLHLWVARRHHMATQNAKVDAGAKGFLHVCGRSWFSRWTEFVSMRRRSRVYARLADDTKNMRCSRRAVLFWRQRVKRRQCLRDLAVSLQRTVSAAICRRAMVAWTQRMKEEKKGRDAIDRHRRTSLKTIVKAWYLYLRMRRVTRATRDLASRLLDPRASHRPSPQLTVVAQGTQPQQVDDHGQTATLASRGVGLLGIRGVAVHGGGGEQMLRELERRVGHAWARVRRAKLYKGLQTWRGVVQRRRAAREHQWKGRKAWARAQLHAAFDLLASNQRRGSYIRFAALYNHRFLLLGALDFLRCHVHSMEDSRGQALNVDLHRTLALQRHGLGQWLSRVQHLQRAAAFVSHARQQRRLQLLTCCYDALKEHMNRRRQRAADLEFAGRARLRQTASRVFSLLSFYHSRQVYQRASLGSADIHYPRCQASSALHIWRMYTITRTHTTQQAAAADAHYRGHQCKVFERRVQYRMHLRRASAAACKLPLRTCLRAWAECAALSAEQDTKMRLLRHTIVRWHKRAMKRRRHRTLPRVAVLRLLDKGWRRLTAGVQRLNRRRVASAVGYRLWMAKVGPPTFAILRAHVQRMGMLKAEADAQRAVVMRVRALQTLHRWLQWVQKAEERLTAHQERRVQCVCGLLSRALGVWQEAVRRDQRAKLSWLLAEKRHRRTQGRVALRVWRDLLLQRSVIRQSLRLAMLDYDARRRYRLLGRWRSFAERRRSHRAQCCEHESRRLIHRAGDRLRSWKERYRLRASSRKKARYVAHILRGVQALRVWRTRAALHSKARQSVELADGQYLFHSCTLCVARWRCFAARAQYTNDNDGVALLHFAYTVLRVWRRLTANSRRQREKQRTAEGYHSLMALSRPSKNPARRSMRKGSPSSDYTLLSEAFRRWTSVATHTWVSRVRLSKGDSHRRHVQLARAFTQWGCTCL